VTGHASLAPGQLGADAAQDEEGLLAVSMRIRCVDAAGEFARDDDRDGFCEVHVETLEGFWSLLRSWLRSHRGISQERLPLYLGAFEFVHIIRRRGKALLGALIALVVAPRNPR
jgi:hypothetical protein